MFFKRDDAKQEIEEIVEAPVEERVEELTRDVRSRVSEVADQARSELADVQAQMRELRRDLFDRALTSRNRVVDELQAAADRIRKEVEGVQDLGVQQRAADLAGELERSASYLEDHTLKEIGKDVKDVAQEQVWQSLGIAFFIGLVVGLFIALGRRR